jgi:hypothetical protein
MSSRDLNNVQSEQKSTKPIAESNMATGATRAEQPVYVQEQDVPAELSDDELAVIAGGADLASVAKITNTEFVKSFVAGVTGVSAGIASYATTHAINKGKTPNTHI